MNSTQPQGREIIRRLVSTMLEAGPDDVSAKEYLQSVQAERPERWVFSEHEIFNPQFCKGTDKLQATVHPEGETDDDSQWVHIIVLRDGTVTDEWLDNEGQPLPLDSFPHDIQGVLREMADHQEELYSPRVDEIATHWRSVFVDEQGNFVRWNRE